MFFTFPNELLRSSNDTGHNFSLKAMRKHVQIWSQSLLHVWTNSIAMSQKGIITLSANLNVLKELNGPQINVYRDI